MRPLREGHVGMWFRKLRREREPLGIRDAVEKERLRAEELSDPNGEVPGRGAGRDHDIGSRPDDDPRETRQQHQKAELRPAIRVRELEKGCGSDVPTTVRIRGRKRDVVSRERGEESFDLHPVTTAR